MRLSDYLSLNKISYAQFAEQVGTDRVSARRHAIGLAVPVPETMTRIYVATNGQVTPNDFYELPELAAVSADPVSVTGDHHYEGRPSTYSDFSSREVAA